MLQSKVKDVNHMQLKNNLVHQTESVMDLGSRQKERTRIIHSCICNPHRDRPIKNSGIVYFVEPFYSKLKKGCSKIGADSTSWIKNYFKKLSTQNINFKFTYFQEPGNV